MTSAAPVPLPNSVAVLPFDNLSPDPDDAYFAVGLHEAILSQLANVREMHVVARASVQGYAGTQKPTPVIARELNVETVLDGSVRYADGQVLVTMHLSDGATNTSLWSESYEHEFSNIFAIQSDIALKVANALKAELLPAERERVTRAPTTSLPAYTLYLQAITRARRATPEETLLAIDDVEQALELDPDFAAAWVLYANLRTGAGFRDPEHAAEHRVARRTGRATCARARSGARRGACRPRLRARDEEGLGRRRSGVSRGSAAQRAARRTERLRNAQYVGRQFRVRPRDSRGSSCG